MGNQNHPPCDNDKCHSCLKPKIDCKKTDYSSGTNTSKLEETDFCCTPNNSPFRFKKVIQCALGEEKSCQNESVILALGIQHYIKEVFESLDYNGFGYVLHEDLQVLLKILGKEYETVSDESLCLCEIDGNDTESCLSNDCKIHLHLDRFAEIICDKFSTFSDNNVLEKRKNSQLVNAVVNVSRRSESLSLISKQIEELERDYLELKTKYKYYTLPNVNDTTNNCISCTKHRLMEGKNNENNVFLENMKLQRMILLQKQELQCLREVIEDLRISLQCSDAENLSLRVKEVKLHQSYLHDDHVLKSFTNSSTDDDKDTIDQIIQSFSSSEDLDLSSNESLLTIRSLRSLSPSRSAKSSQLQIEERSSILTKKLLEKIGSDDTDLNKEIQQVYQELTDTKNELEDTRNDLENTVSEIQAKNDYINKLLKSLNETKSNFDKSTEENANLKEKIVALRQNEKERDSRVQILEKELNEIKTELHNSEEETKTLKNELEIIKNKRKLDIQQLYLARNLVAKSLTKISQKDGAKSQEILESSANLERKNDNGFSVQLNDATKPLVNNVKPSNIIHSSNNFVSRKGPSDNTDMGPDYNYQLSTDKDLGNRRATVHPFESRNNKLGDALSADVEDLNKGFQKDENRGKLLASSIENKSLKELPPLSRSFRKNKTRNNNNNSEEKPVLEVKPSLIRPYAITRLHSETSDPTVNKNTINSSPTSVENIWSIKSIDIPTSKTNISELMTETKADNENNRKISDENILEHPKKVSIEESNQSKTSTEILEGLEAEVEYLLSIL